MTTVALIALAVLAGLAWIVRRGEAVQSGYRGREAREDIDRDMLEEAEREVRDLDALHDPDQGFEGDDWGPGAAK